MTCTTEQQGHRSGQTLSNLQQGAYGEVAIVVGGLEGGAKGQTEYKACDEEILDVYTLIGEARISINKSLPEIAIV